MQGIGIQIIATDTAQSVTCRLHTAGSYRISK